MTVEGLTFSQYLYSLNNQQALDYWLNMERAVNSGQISPNAFAETIENVTGRAVTIHRSASGDVLGYTLDRVSTVSSSNPLNSNVSTVARGTISAPVSTGIDATTGTATASRLTGVGTKLLTGAALVGTAAMCVGTGITLGKTIDSALYNLNPDFWDSNGMSSLNPETWSAITDGNDSLGASLLNVLFGFDNDGKTQAYIDENAFAYFAAYMQSMGVFSVSDTGEIDNTHELDIDGYTTPITFDIGSHFYFRNVRSGTYYSKFTASKPVNMFFVICSNGKTDKYVSSDTPFNYGTATLDRDNLPLTNLPDTAVEYKTYEGKTVYGINASGGYRSEEHV